MLRAIALSRESVERGGGPFGAVVVRDNRIIGEGSNGVVPTADLTAHAEVTAIRAACRTEGSHSLEGAEIYTTTEPCPMCLGAIWWARIGRVYYGNSRDDAAGIGFDDAAIYDEMATPLERRRLPLQRFMAGEAHAVFERWFADPNRKPY
jgi:guanine deaminase